MGRIRDRAARSVYRILPLLHPAEPIAVHYRIGIAHVYQVVYSWTALKKCEKLVSTSVVKSSLQCSTVADGYVIVCHCLALVMDPTVRPN